ncbi:MFS transporter [Actinomadura barringtoniae]|uniref:MFS transporter n=1 Tax=Actinomadura barringtoniae TaxID=1427535 RepID=A0A939PTM5_9ACTN|nr:MFS transporter [Actinomadura barringtoniae]MBO2454849.1 MFS transporter [Actinomadura barringtoniae]
MNRLLLPVILSATFMSSFDYMVVNVATPSFQSDLHAGPVALELVVAGYAFTYAAGLVTGGRLGDLFGHRRMFALGMAAFTVASLLCGLAQSPAQLVAFRLLQGLTAAAMVPQVLALVTTAVPAPERPRAMAWFGAVLGGGGVCGQVLGGLLLDADIAGLGWRPIFLINVPIGVVAVTAALRLLPGGRGTRRPRLDPVGVVGISGALALALVPLAAGREEGWPAWTWICLAASIPAMAATLLWERRLTRTGGEPLLDLGLFRARSFNLGLAVNVTFMTSFASMNVVLTLLLQAGLGLSPLQAGLSFGPMAILTMVTSLLGRRLITRYGTKVLPAGALFLALGILAMAVELRALGDDVNAVWILVALCLTGIGGGLTLPSVIGAVLSGVKPDQAGSASGVLSTTQQFSGATGVAVIGAIFFAALGSHPARPDYTGAAEIALWGDLALAAGTVVLTLFLIRPAKPAAPSPAPREPVLDRRL